MNSLDAVSSFVGALAGLLGLLTSVIQFQHEDRSRFINDLLTPQNLRFLGRFGLMTGLLVIATCFLLKGEMLVAGIGLMTSAGVRLASPRKAGWTPERLAFHISSEVLFHCTALLSLAAGLNLVALGALRDLATGQRLTVTLTLTLAALISVNKSTTRTRKLCTEMSRQVSGLVQHISALQELCSLNERNDKIPDKKRECYEKLHNLELALDTRLNTGYRSWGTRVLPVATSAALSAALRGAVAKPDKESSAWEECRSLLSALHSGCSKHIDVVA
ncbi:hypothetical protein AB0E78_31850 [Streptomyces sp. NPDC032198]|uniref:hypothetical protein n=1 Tax=Streptomyces sp. NPDC032198 TaxID=3155127 RepID=UPI0033D18999